MSGEKEFNKLLDNIPSDANYKFAAKLRLAHRLFHEATTELNVVQIGIVDPVETLKAMIDSIPSKHLQARQLIDEICGAFGSDLFENLGKNIMEVTQSLYISHNELDKINHKF